MPTFLLLLLWTLPWQGFAALSLQPQAATAAAPGSYLRAEDHRIAAVTYRLASGGARFCRSAHPVTGMLLQHLGDYAPADRAEAVRAFQLDKGPGVLSAVEGSPAAKAGLIAGDVLVSVNGKPFPAPGAAAAEADPRKRRLLIEASEQQLEQQLRLGPARLGVLREGRPLSLTLHRQMGCLARGRLARSNQPNAFADGRYAIMTTKMLGFFKSDDELAVAMAHELSHNILGHRAELDANNVPRGVLRNFGKNAARVHAVEEEADRLGIKLVWAAGYDVAAAIPFWRRLYARYDPIPTPKLFRTHPSLGAREKLIQQTIAELRASSSKPGA